MLRATALSLLVLFSIATMLPLAHSSAHNSGSSAVSHRKKKRIRRHSRAWWRRYRAHLRRKRAMQLQNAPKPYAPENSRDDAALSPNASAMTGGTYNDPRGIFSLTLPGGWTSRPVSANGETMFRIYAPGGRPVGRAVLSVVPSVAASDGALSARARARALGGVPMADLRRTVIDKMIAMNGWVINDLEREINGRRVLVVIAQTAESSDGRTPQQSWAFYFTEMDGRIYSLATSTPLEFADRLALESEQMMASFRARRPSTLAVDSPPSNR
jgi:hypothetical protein